MIDLSATMQKVGLRMSAPALSALVAHATKAKFSPAKVCEELVALELREREERNLARRTKTATLGNFKTIDQFDWNHPRKIDRELYEELLGLDFIEPGQNVLIRGPAGVGKTTLAQNLGIQALKKGHTVRFSTVPAVLADLLRQESIPAMERRIKRYTLPDLVVLDELGYVPCDSRAADLFFNIISRRHEKRSVVLTTNLPFKQWGTVFQDATCIGPLVDRFAQHCHVLDIEADSWRQRSKGRPPASERGTSKRPAKRQAK